MKRFDINDDETISLQELLGTQPLGPAPPIELIKRKGARPKANAQVPFHLITPSDNPETVALLLLSNYRKAGAVALTPADCDLGPGVFASLDANKDGKLDMAELEKWQLRPAALEFVIRIGKTNAKEPPTDLLQPGGKKPALAKKVTRTADGVLSLTVDDSQLSFGRAVDDTDRLTRFVVLRGSLLQLFRNRLDPKKGFVELADLDGPQFQPLRQLFKLLDRDGDGKLTEKEVQAYVQLENGAPNCTTLLKVQDQGRALFQLLDANRDGRLSLRELRTAWERLAPLDKNGDGVITPDEITRQFLLSASVGVPNGLRFVTADGFAGGREAPTPATTAGPLWFRKMDRHGIGDVSFRNFLGTRADFDRIDTDGDGLISVEEAEAYDRKMRLQQPDRR
jgi:Ca2+-binding EF-hand superfamily protein